MALAFESRELSSPANRASTAPFNVAGTALARVSVKPSFAAQTRELKQALLLRRPALAGYGMCFDIGDNLR